MSSWRWVKSGVTEGPVQAVPPKSKALQDRWGLEWRAAAVDTTGCHWTECGKHQN